LKTLLILFNNSGWKISKTHTGIPERINTARNILMTSKTIPAIIAFSYPVKSSWSNCSENSQVKKE